MRIDATFDPSPKNKNFFVAEKYSIRRDDKEEMSKSFFGRKDARVVSR